MVYAYIFLHLICALVAGVAVGIERSYHGRAAGMRTYALVCLGSTLAIIASFHPEWWGPGQAADVTDRGVTRVIQGIVTGIGFLGAGVIVKEGLSIRGLTTAASIWVTAGIGLLIGVGFYATASIATLLTLGTLSVFRRIEDRMPTRSYLHCYVRFRADNMMAEDALRALIADCGFQVAELSYKLHGEPKVFEYRLVLFSTAEGAPRMLAETLKSQATVAEFRLAPSRD